MEHHSNVSTAPTAPVPPHSIITLVCSSSNLNEHEYLINLKIKHHGDEKEEIKNLNKNLSYSIEKTECPESYAILLSLIDFFNHLDETEKKFHFEIYTKDLFVYNILTDYLWKWKARQWMMSQGTVAAYVDILESLFNVLQPLPTAGLSFHMNKMMS